MFPRPHPQDAPGERRTILLIADESPVRGLVSTFLTTMGCACAIISNNADLSIAEREFFDAVLIDLANAGVPVEQAIQKIQSVQPGLSEKFLVFSSGVTDPRMVALIGRYGLQQLSQGILLQELWATLQEFFSPPRSAMPLQRDLQVAQLIFDSFRSPQPAGLRASGALTRQLAYQHRDATIDLLIEAKEESGRVSLAGQVLGFNLRKGANHGLAVLLIDRMKTLARTATNQFGEFHLEFEFVEGAGLQIRVSEGSWASIPLGKLEWVKKRLAGS
jgi:CheY-like chemotaxis protein